MILKYTSEKINGKKIKKICEDIKVACQAIGETKAKSVFKILRRVAVLEEFDDLYNIPYFEQLSGDRKEEYSIRIDANYRLIVGKIIENNQTVLIINIEDYH